MTLLREAAPSSGVTSVGYTAPEVQEQIAKDLERSLPPYLRLLYHKSLKGLRNLYEPFPTEWSQVYSPKEGPVDFELPFEEVYGRGENPWNFVGERMVLGWGDLDKSYNTAARKGELRRGITDIVAKVDFSDGHKPSIRVKLGKNLGKSLQNLNDLFGAMAAAHREVVDDLRKRGDSLSLDQLQILQGSQFPYWS